MTSCGEKVENWRKNKGMIRSPGDALSRAVSLAIRFITAFYEEL